ncbi:trans-1,2-dihydrobenzene-1,2-diol dehydrogenase-like [Anticarsia gemmatalis]|uniref:trans-1,2-dihydrobenzene-1,2-diol dehydrogenase-like n=1 Tax=Anticarsia gemmatalis TaxID=129554 RepID=UPI003F75835E
MSSKTKTLRWGIVTAGKICNDFVNAFNSYPDKGDQVIMAVAARNMDSAAQFAVTRNIPKVYDSYQVMAESDDIDVVYIGALNPYHYELSKLYLENGKHVLCEKPFCMNEKQAASLISIAKSKKLFLMEGVWSRFSPAYLDMEKEINAGKIGDVRFFEVNFGICSDAERINKKEFGGSALLDIGIYVLQIALFIFKEEPTKVTAVGTLNDQGVDISETIILEFEGGRRAVLNTHTQQQLRNQATVYGTKGRITLNQPFHFPNEMILSDGTVKRYELHTSPIPYNFENSAGLVFEAIEVAKCINLGLLESPRMTHKESILFAKIEDNIRRQLGVHFDEDDKNYGLVTFL